ncbi:hypothetical protein EDI_043420 [Entamoeba dispar SAW760]|uniref:Uncharacterized protein n=1 Tax=Entamoeba dispar (strain ATCC PRA-260 / SAW760) TaxID=370354 RepID=B0ESE0_ENTDS|nr:uncharacterized protein EDI_043420 [Entamoeba dispar SAW760]EDR22564.1 hypothetical protein EDI_043420 [Entamoeba dispar SAW760]|eukprot:EDR22564.1 hypothetical protein EDI_043420 [Entamoeba dispar SAW760]
MEHIINVMVIHSHSGGYRTWDYISQHWKEFGNIQINISFKKNITKEILESESPDILVFGDCAGAPYQFNLEELDSIESYLNENCNKHLLGTYAVFYHKEGPQGRVHEYDNRSLCKYFGIIPETQLVTSKMPHDPTYLINYQNPLLWKNIMQPYTSKGYSSSQVPKNGVWIENDQIRDLESDVRILAETLDGKCIITNKVTTKYTSLYISHMPEYESMIGNKVDGQMLYNCLVYLMSQNIETPLVNLCIKTLKYCKSKEEEIPLPLVKLLKQFQCVIEP